MTTTEAAAPHHPATFTPSVFAAISAIVRGEADRLGRQVTVLDPMAGTGAIHLLRGGGCAAGARTYGIELEQEWADANEWTMQGDATALPFDEQFDIIATSRLRKSHG